MTAARIWWKAVKSGWKAGIRQFRKRRTELRREHEIRRAVRQQQENA